MVFSAVKPNQPDLKKNGGWYLGLPGGDDFRNIETKGENHRCLFGFIPLNVGIVTILVGGG